MEAKFRDYGRRLRLLGSLAVCLLAVAGCATHKIDWASRVGTYTYDQAILELGPPDKQAKLDDGSVVADWMIRRGYTRVYPAYGWGTYPYGYRGWYGPYYPSYWQDPDWFLRLMFGPDNKLKDWKKFAR